MSLPIQLYCQVQKPDTSFAWSLLDSSAFYLMKRGEAKRNIELSLHFSQEALKFSKTLNYSNGITEAWFLTGKAYIKSHQNLEANSVIQKADAATGVRLMLEFIQYNTTFEGANEQVLNTAKAYADKSLQVTETHKLHRLGSQTLLQFANIEYFEHRPATGKSYFLKAIEAVQKTKWIEGEAEIFSQMSTYLKLNADPSLISDVEACGQRVLKGYQKLEEKKERGDVQRLLIVGYDQLSFHYLYKGNLDLAYERSLQMVRLLEKESNPFSSEVPYQTLGKICLELGRFEESIDYVRRADAIVLRKGEILDGSALKTITKAYIHLNRPKEALRFLEILVSRGGYDDLRSKKLIAESIGNSYFAMKQYGKAEKYYLDSYEIGKQLGKEQTFVASLPLGRLYVTTGQYNKARPYLQALVDSGSRTVPLFTKRDANWLLFQADSATSNFLSAINHLKQYKSLNDSIFNEGRNGQIEALKLEYETEKKDKDLQILSKHSQLQEAALRQAKFIKNVFIAGAVGLFIVLGMVYSRYRFRMRTNRLLQAKQKEINEQNLRLKHNNETLQKLISEKEWLVREIHHRVKNNLQIVISLFNAQSDFTDHPTALKALQEGRERMQAIALLHQKLYGHERGNKINMASYVPEMIGNLKSSAVGSEQLGFEIDVDPIELDVAQAVPVGLILNEAITNAIKYAYPPAVSGAVRVALKQIGERELLLKIADDGVGFPSAFKNGTSDSLGLQLIKLFAEQLEGHLKLDNQNGAEVSLLFMRQELDETISASTYKTHGKDTYR